MRTLTVIIGCVLLFAGCEQGIVNPADPNIPQIVDPNIEDMAEGAVGLVQTLGLIWPALLPIGGAAGGILAAYRRLKPKIKAAEVETDKYHAGGELLAVILDDVKKNYPETWQKIGPEIKKAKAVSKDVSAAIDGFRGA